MPEKKQPEESPKPAKAGEVAAPEDKAQPLTQEEKAEKARRDLARYMSWVMPLKGRFAFRGQANADWGLDSSAYRRLEEKMKRYSYAAHSIFVGYLHERVNEARMRFSEYGDKQPLEVMAHLQHYGAATGLIDFTENALAALWFACKDQPRKDGKVFAVRLDNPEQIREIKTREGLKGELDGFFGKKRQGNTLWAWRPGDGNARMVTQQSLFVFGRPGIGEEFFSVSPYEVPAGEKELLLQILEQSGISETFMFSDFAGFAAGNAAGKEYDFHRAKTYYDEKIDDAERAGGGTQAEKSSLYLNRGNLNHALGLYSDAEKDSARAVELDPESAAGHNNLGNALSASRRFDDALVSYGKAIELDPENAVIYANQAAALNEEGRYEEAVASCDKAVELDPKFAVAHSNRGSALYRWGRYEEAVASCNKAIELDPTIVSAYNNRGNALVESGRYEEALASYDKAVELDPKFAAVHNNRGGVLHRRKRPEEACAAWKEAKRLAELSGNMEVAKAASSNLAMFCK